MEFEALNYYEVLDVEPDVETSKLRRAYHKASLKHHPDKNPGAEEEARQRFVVVGQAYETLSDRQQRAAYDRELQQGSAKAWRDRRAASGEEQSYNDAFEKFSSHVASMTPEELAIAEGAAAMVGSIVGSLIASQLGGKAGGAAGSFAASIVGGMVGSNVASAAVHSVHDRSVDKALLEERRQAALDRGEELPEEPSMFDAMKKKFDPSPSPAAEGGAAATAAAAGGAAKAKPAPAPGGEAARQVSAPDATAPAAKDEEPASFVSGWRSLRKAVGEVADTFGPKLAAAADTVGTAASDAATFVGEKYDEHEKARTKAELGTEPCADDLPGVPAAASAPRRVWAPGTAVRLEGINSRPELNGRSAVILQYDAEKARYVVDLLIAEDEQEETISVAQADLEEI